MFSHTFFKTSKALALRTGVRSFTTPPDAAKPFTRFIQYPFDKTKVAEVTPPKHTTSLHTSLSALPLSIIHPFCSPVGPSMGE